MAKNPYEWLGLDPKTKNPHHFQLLGVSTKVEDPTAFKKSIEAHAKLKLAMLKKVTKPEYAKHVEQLKKRIMLAYNVLGDDQKRSKYIKQLRAKIDTAKKQREQPSAADAAAPNADRRPAASIPRTGGSGGKSKSKQGRDTVSTPDEMTTDEQKKLAQRPTVEMPSDYLTPPTNLQSPSQKTGSGHAQSQVVIDAPVPDSAEDIVVKRAIPMAVPLSPAAQPATNIESGAGFDSADLLGGVAIKAKPRGKKKKSMASIIVLTLMLLAGIGGAVGIYLNLDGFLKMAGIDPDKVPSSPGIIEEEEKKPPITSANQPPIDSENDPGDKSDPDLPASTKELVGVDLDSIPELDVDEVMSHPETLDATRTTAEQNERRAAWLKRRLELAGEEPIERDDDPNDPAVKGIEGLDFNRSTETETNPNGSDTADADWPKSDDSESDLPAKELDFNQLVEYQKRIRMARRSLKRRDILSASYQIGSLDRLLMDSIGEEFSLAPEQQELESLLVSYGNSVDLLQGFWEQVINSCKAMSGGQEIDMGTQMLGFVEANDELVILRNAGANISYHYEFLPPGLAVKLGNLGAVPDIPTWRMQQAVFYSLYAEQNPELASNVEELVSLSEDDGHDGDGIRQFLNFNLNKIAAADSKSAPLTDDEHDVEIGSFRSSHQYTDVRKVNSAEAEDLGARLLDESPAEKPKQIAYLEEARLLGIRAGNAWMVEDAIEELSTWVEFDKADLKADSFSDLSSQKLEPTLARRLLETAIPFLKSPAIENVNARDAKQLYTELGKMATENGFEDAVRRLRQIQ